jgi:hypothetical protein
MDPDGNTGSSNFFEHSRPMSEYRTNERVLIAKKSLDFSLALESFLENKRFQQDSNSPGNLGKSTGKS